VNKPVVISVLGVLVVAAAIILNFVLDSSDDGSSRRTKMTAERTEASPAARPTPAPLQPANADAPSFDVVRINPQGDTVMAGRAKPGATVEIYDGDKKIGEVESDRRGEWVFVPETPLAPGNRRLSLSMREKDGSTVPSASDVVVIVPERGTEGQALAMRVPKEGQPGSVEILQRPADDQTGTTGNVQRFSVDAVDYDAMGTLDIVGKALPGSLVQLYLDNQFLGRTKADERGHWSFKPATPVGAGNYELRADQIEADGKVVSRMVVHFARSQPLKDVKPGALVVVRDGNSLWRIARNTYGDGFKYTSIFNANREQIKDADLIFPGQVFKLPEIN
jgi:hypothetical protein